MFPLTSSSFCLSILNSRCSRRYPSKHSAYHLILVNTFLISAFVLENSWFSSLFLIEIMSKEILALPGKPNSNSLHFTYRLPLMSSSFLWKCPLYFMTSLETSFYIFIFNHYRDGTIKIYSLISIYIYNSMSVWVITSSPKWLDQSGSNLVCYICVTQSFQIWNI